MALSIVTDSSLETPFNGRFGTVCWSVVNYSTSGDTVQVPLGCVSAAVLPVSGGSAPTITISAGDGSGSSAYDTLTFTGGTTGFALLLVTRHGGNVASAR
jgi:hypothetical protein